MWNEFRTCLFDTYFRMFFGSKSFTTLDKEPFKEYLRESEPDKVHKSYVWSTAIGLQAVDGLKPSKYLVDTAIQNIEGKITMKEVQSLIDSYYKERPVHLSDDERTEEADKVSSRIAEILSETAFTFSPNEYIAIHRKLFHGIYKYAGKIRDYNITKNEWVLDGATVMYGSASELRATLEYDFSQEKDFSYRGLSMDEIIHHLAVFISRLWHIQDKKVDIESILSQKGNEFSIKTTVHIYRLFEKFGFDEVFGRSVVMELLELKGSGASKFLSNLVQADIIEPVSGYGKGKYKFKK